MNDMLSFQLRRSHLPVKLSVEDMRPLSEQKVFVSFGTGGRTVCLGDRRHVPLLLLLLLLSVWPQQDTSSEIMGLCPWLISSFMAHVWALHLYSTCCYDRPVKVGSGELTRHKSTTTSRTEALLSGFSVHKRLYKHHYTEELTRRLVCRAL